MNNYPLGNFLIQIKNAHLAGKSQVTTPYSRIKEEIAKILVDGGFLATVEKKKIKDKKFFNLEVSLGEEEKKKTFWEVKLYSKPGCRYYAKTNEIPYPPTSQGLVIISTPKGLMRGFEARKKNTGGEVIAVVW